MAASVSTFLENMCFSYYWSVTKHLLGVLWPLAKVLSFGFSAAVVLLSEAQSQDVLGTDLSIELVLRG